MAPARSELPSVGQSERRVAVPLGLNLLDSVDGDDYPAVDPDESTGIYLPLQVLQGVANQVHARTDVKGDIVTLGLNPIDPFDIDITLAAP